jgi:3-oxoacyl-[acyl-carrier protein] reductase
MLIVVCLAHGGEKRGMAEPVSFDLRGKVALVTGAGRNIGQAIAVELARAGARVVVNGHRDKDALSETIAEIEAIGSKGLSYLADVGDAQAVEKMVTAAQQTFGSLDIVVCNAAVRPHQAFLDISLEDWDRTLRTNLSSCFFISRAALPLMTERKWGRIIHISGMDGYTGQTNRAHNVVCKAGVHALAKALGQEFGPHGITANVVAPGWIDTIRDWSQYPTLRNEKEIRRIPVRRIGTVTDIAAACLYLASPSAGFINGQVIHANGGRYMF